MTKNGKIPKTKAELLDQFIQIAIADGYSDYGGAAERLINETISVYENLPEEPKLQIPKQFADLLDNRNYSMEEFVSKIVVKKEYGVYVEGSNYDKFLNWLESDENNSNSSAAYLNPLTRQFVEVIG